ncbi:MAG TPA: hypothetical protein VM165_12165 [Planctomycetaceae bacterium]|nr:hypothetical protein [Planctomycetaceae bacterium]
MLTTLPGRLFCFTALVGGLGLACGAVGYAMSGWLGVECAVWAAALCLPPGWLVFSLEPLYRSPRTALNGTLIGTLVRMGVVLGGVMLAEVVRPELPKLPLMISLGVVYLGALTFETLMLLRNLSLRPARASKPSV